MKKLFLFLLLFTATLAVSAQAPLKFGYFSFDAALKAMPEYAVSQRNLADLRSKYDAETKRVEDEFNKKYEQFLDGQRDFVPTILRKRQAELQELMDKNVTFKAEAVRLLKQAEADSFGPLREKLKTVVRRIGAERGYAFICNTDGDALPYVDSMVGEDINTIVMNALK